MCNLAGYVGDRPAAPILLDMMEWQEGFGGGFYSGIATISDGQLFHAKVIGDVKALRRETNAEGLPGEVGIVHSRSKGGGDVEWGHPFLDCSGRVAYVANGHPGLLAEGRDAEAMVKALLEEGHEFRATRPDDGDADSPYALMPDGRRVHTSEVVCHLIASLGAARGCPVLGMRQAFMKMPAEIVGLALHLDAPDCVIASRFNQPLMIGRDESGTWLSTTAMAFPDSVKWIAHMPTCATAAFRRDRYEVFPFEPGTGRVADVFPWEAGLRAIVESLRTGEPQGLGALKKATASLWPADAAPQKNMMVYEIMRSLHQEGRIRFVSDSEPGVLPGTPRPRKRAFATDALPG